MRILRWSPLAVSLSLLVAACGPPPEPVHPTTEVPVGAAPTSTATAPEEPGGIEITESPVEKPASKPAVKPAQGGGPAVSSIPGTSIRFEGGDGKTRDTAILIKGAKGEIDGVASEYQFLSIVHGRKGADWKLSQQALIDHNGHQMDEMSVTLANGQSLVYYFDISEFFGKF